MHSKPLMPLVLVVCLVILGSLFVTIMQPASAEETHQTWPSRTPTPGNEPTKPPASSTPGGGNPPTATTESTPVVEVTSTPVSVVASPSPTMDSTGISIEPVEEGITGEGPLPNEVAGGCEVPPSVQATGRIEVKDAPEVDALVIGYIEIAETRKIIGRSEIAPWWLIQFSPDLQGWVSDPDVLVLGYTGYVPIILTSDDITSAEATWNPTPNPQCTPAPVATIAGDILHANGEQSVDQAEAAISDQMNAETELSSNQVDNTDPDLDQSRAIAEDIETIPDQPSFLWLLITGAILIVVGTLSILFRMRKS